MLNAVTILAAAGAILLLIWTIDRERILAEIPGWLSWRPGIPTWFETIVTGVAVGLVSFALLSAFVPETQSDAIRQHLPIAREIWQTGSAGEFAPMGVSQYPVQAHLLFAAVYGFGGIPAAKLVQSFIGLAGIFGVAGIGWFVAGRVAAVVSAAVFATMPIVLWELGHAYVDLFPVFFTVGAVLCTLLWQRDGALPWLIVAGALAGTGVAAKLSMAWMVVALATAIFLVGHGPWQFWNRILAVLALGLGTAAVVVPWLIRSYTITGSLPGQSLIIDRITSIVQGLNLPGADVLGPASPPSAPVDSVATSTVVNQSGDLGLGRAAPASDRSPLDLVRIPWQMTFHGEVYHSQGAGDIGIALLTLFPAAILSPRNRAIALLAVTTAVSYIGWWLSPQITRQLLPTLAIAAVLVGAGVASIIDAVALGPRRVLPIVVSVGVVVGLFAAPLLFLPNWKTGVPVDLILGKESPSAYIAREVPSASALMAASDEFPVDAPVGYIGIWEGPQIYTEARLIYTAGEPFGTEPNKILAHFDGVGIDHLVWNRPESRLEDWRSVLLSTDFLRDHTRVIAGDQGTYVFEFLPGEGKTWGADTMINRLDDPGLDRVGDDGPWTTVGRVRAKEGVVTIYSLNSVAQRVSVSGGSPYVLVTSGDCAEPGDRAVLTLRWFDEHDIAFSTASEWVVPGPEQSEQFMWRRAPERATTVSAELTATGSSKCEFDEMSLYELS
jgi:4-amino-4-deoxy-L-arabinose transferase-like glycosyltransferase